MRQAGDGIAWKMSRFVAAWSLHRPAPMRSLWSMFVAASLAACSVAGSEDGVRSADSALAVTQSRLAPHHLGGSAELDTWIDACPRVLKVFGADMGVIDRYRSNCAGGKVVVRIWVEHRDVSAGDDYFDDAHGRTDGELYWNKIAPQLGAIPSAIRNQIYVESANEWDFYPPFKNPAYYNGFFIRFSELASAAGYRPLVGNFSVGSIDAAGVSGCKEGIKFAVSKGGAWSYHAYSKDLSKDPNSDSSRNWPFRYRSFLDANPDLRGLPLILTEGGMDDAGDPATSGWQARVSKETYMDWLRWFDGELRKDPEVVAVTLFAIGGDGWKSFQLGPLVPDLVAQANAAGRDGSSGSSPVAGGAIAECVARNGGAAAVGAPFDNGGGAAVHRWGAGDVQDFTGGALGPNLCMQHDGEGTAWMVRGAIRSAYLDAGGGPGWLGYPREDEHLASGVPAQQFEHGYVTWRDGSYQAFAGSIPSASPPPPPPTPKCPCEAGKNNICQYAPNTAGCDMTAAGGYCDPNGDGGYDDADWVRGWNDYKAACGG